MSGAAIKSKNLVPYIRYQETGHLEGAVAQNRPKSQFRPSLVANSDGCLPPRRYEPPTRIKPQPARAGLGGQVVA